MTGLAVVMMLVAPIVGSLPPEPRAIPSFNPATSGALGQIRSDVRKGREERSLSRRQARELRREAGEIAMLEQRYASGGLTTAEAAELRARIEVLRAMTRGKRLGTVR